MELIKNKKVETRCIKLKEPLVEYKTITVPNL